MNLFPRFSRNLLPFVVVLATFLAFSPAVMAEDAPDVYEYPFNGSFTEFSLRGGPVLDLGEGTPFTLDAGFRNSFPFYLGDHRISYRFTTAAGDEPSSQIHSLHGALALHPFYLALLSRGLFSHFLASLHLELGFGPQFGMLAAHGEQDSQSRFGFAGSLGTGFDIPLTNANAGQALWLNVLYRRTWTTLSFGGEDFGEGLHDHGFFLGLGWRINGTIWRD